MKNTFLKTTLCIAGVVIGTSVFAGDHHHGPNSGVRLAADIVDLVGCSLNILRGGPTVVYTEPAPVVYTEPVYTAPAPVVYTTPVYYSPRPYYYRPAPPPPPRYWHGPRRGPGPHCGPRHRR